MLKTSNDELEQGDLYFLDSESDLPPSLKEKFDSKSKDDFDLILSNSYNNIDI